MSKRDRINKLYSIISDSKNELYEIRKDCKHDEGYTVANYGDPRNSSPTKLCNICDEPFWGQEVTYDEAVKCALESRIFTDPKEAEKYEKEIKKDYQYLKRP